MFEQLQAKGRARSVALLHTLENDFDRILKMWLIGAGIACCLRMVTAPMVMGGADFRTVAPYMLLVVAPVASAFLALRWFANGHLQPQPECRLAVLGRWRDVSSKEAQRHKLYGASGLMVSLLVGMMLHVPIRAMEYLVGMPPVPSEAPHWLRSLHMAMTFDAVLFSSLYMVAFVAALRRVPLFPRLLAAIWTADLAMQMFLADVVSRIRDLPAPVEASLLGLLEGNSKKVLISAALWLPYLLLSRRVNVTYRSRVAAGSR